MTRYYNTYCVSFVPVGVPHGFVTFSPTEAVYTTPERRLARVGRRRLHPAEVAKTTLDRLRELS